MPSLEDDTPPEITDPYATLELPSTASTSDIKKSYRRLALKHHPDKAPPESLTTATQKFQSIAYAYAILSSPQRKARYDATGRTEDFGPDGDEEEGEFGWAEFYRAQFSEVVSEEGIERFRKEYQGSEEERDDVIAAYEEYKGDMELGFESVMLSDFERDEERFRAVIEEAIEKGEVKRYKKFTRESEVKKQARRKRARAEEAEAEELAEELGLKDKLKKIGGGGKKGGKEDGEEGLKALIMQRQQGRQEALLEGLLDKYGPKPKRGKKGKKEVVDEPPEEMFERNRKRAKVESEAAANGGRSKRNKS